METNNTNPQAQNLSALQSEVWQAYYDAFGVRPRHFTPEEWQDVTFLQDTFKICIDEMFS